MPRLEHVVTYTDKELRDLLREDAKKHIKDTGGASAKIDIFASPDDGTKTFSAVVTYSNGKAS